MKATIWKAGDETKFVLSDSNIKVNQGSDLVMINPKLVKKLRLKIKPISTLVSHCLGMFVANGDSTELEIWVKFWVEVLGICWQIWPLVTPNDNFNVSLLLELPWLQSVNAKLFIQKKEIYIGDIKKREMVSQILYSITPSKDTWFEASSKSEVDEDKSSEEGNTDVSDGYSTDK